MPHSAYIVSAVRTPGGRRNGTLRKRHPVDLAAEVIDEVVNRAGVAPEDVDDVILGCVDQIGAQAGNIGRNAVLASSLPESVPGTTVDRQCGSSQQALHFAAQAVMSGTQDVVIAGGIEVMSLVPIGSYIIDGYKAGRGAPHESVYTQEKYPNVRFSQFMGAEIIAKEWGFSREFLEEFAVQSHAKAAHATEAGYFEREIMPTKGHTAGDEDTVLLKDEGIRYDCTAEGLAGLNVLADDGVITAGTSSQITDGASAVLIVNEAGLKKVSSDPMVRIVALELAGADPIRMLTGPIPATQRLLKRAGKSIADIDLYEVNEAFAPVPLAWERDLEADRSKLNVNGGAMALGHPLGATGTKLMTTLVHELDRRGARYGVQAICEGGGTANAALIERC